MRRFASVQIAPELPDAVRHHDCKKAIARGARPAKIELDRFDLDCNITSPAKVHPFNLIGDKMNIAGALGGSALTLRKF